MQASPIGTMAGPLRRRIGAALGSPVWRMFCLGVWREIKKFYFFFCWKFFCIYDMLGYVSFSICLSIYIYRYVYTYIDIYVYNIHSILELPCCTVLGKVPFATRLESRLPAFPTPPPAISTADGFAREIARPTRTWDALALGTAVGIITRCRNPEIFFGKRSRCILFFCARKRLVQRTSPRNRFVTNGFIFFLTQKMMGLWKKMYLSKIMA